MTMVPACWKGKK